MPTDPPGLSAHPISFTIQIPPPQPRPGPCEWAHSTTWTFPCSQEDFSPSLSAGQKPGQHLGITLSCQCPTAPCPHTQGGESTIHCIPSPSLPHPIPCKPDFPTHPTGQQVWLPHTMSVLLLWGLRGCCRWSLLQPWPGLGWTPSHGLCQPSPGRWHAARRGQHQMETQPWQSLAAPQILPALGRGAAPRFYLISSAQHDQEPLQALTAEGQEQMSVPQAARPAPRGPRCSNGKQWINQANLEGFCKPGSQEFGGSVLISRNSWVTDTTQAG